MRTEGVNISRKKATLFISVALLFFLMIGACSASELDNVTSTEDLDLIEDNDILSLSELESSDIVSAKEIENQDLLQNEIGSDTGKLAGTETTNVTKLKTTLTINDARYSKTNTVFKVTLKDSNGTFLGNQSISLKVNGKTYKATTESNGIAYIKTAALNKGAYTVTAAYNGDAEHVKSSLSKKVNVYSSIPSSNMKKTYGVSKSFSATFYRDNDRLANTTVTFTISGKKYHVKTDSKGVAQLGINLNPGKYTIKLYNPYSKETVSKTITVNKDSSKFTEAKNTYILPKTKYSYSITLKTGHNAPIKNAKIQFTYNSKKASATTDANGNAKITISALSKGTYKLNYNFNGNSKYKSASGSKNLYVKDSTTTLKSSGDLKVQYNDGSKFSVKATDSSKKALANKNIKFSLNGKISTAKTDSNGVAKIAVGDLKPGTYTVKFSYSTAGLSDYNIKSNSIQVIRQTVTLDADDFVMKYNDGSEYQVTVKNKTGTPLKDIVVKFILNGKSIKTKTDESGIAKLAVNESIGYYQIDMGVVDSTYYTSSKITKHILVNGTKFQASDLTLSVDTTGTFSVKLIDGQNKAVANKAIKFTLNGKTQSVQTDSNGVAKLTISGLSKGTYEVTYTDGSASGSSKINIVNQVTLKDIITASQNVKKYIESNDELPNTVKIGGVTYSTAVFVYLASQAIINLKNNKQTNINIISVNEPSSPKDASNLGNLYDYLSVAKSVVNTANSKGIMPNSVSSNLGNIGYNGWVYAAARVVAYYGDNSFMPNYVTIKTYSGSTSSPLNSKNTITNLAPYLKSSTNCQVGNAKIKSIVNSVTAGLTTDLAKAKAIYNYVRDAISYSFYYDTKYGAVGTLNAKTGNCVDQAHLLIAMYRTAGLAARYVHGTCTFSSGTYGHVWAQVLIGDTWIVSDPTSARNSFGTVVNWNNYNYQLKGYYSSIAF